MLFARIGPGDCCFFVLMALMCRHLTVTGHENIALGRSGMCGDMAGYIGTEAAERLKKIGFLGDFVADIYFCTRTQVQK